MYGVGKVYSLKSELYATLNCLAGKVLVHLLSYKTTRLIDCTSYIAKTTFIPVRVLCSETVVEI